MATHTESSQSSGTKAAIGLGPNRGGDFPQEDYHHPAAAWGTTISVSKVLIKQGALIDGARAVFKMNHQNGGYDCLGCAWPDDRKGLRMDICENGIKHATWKVAREIGTNNLPDCSNSRHEASGRALSAAIGTGKGGVSKRGRVIRTVPITS
jgi:hypothetical protein